MSKAKKKNEQTTKTPKVKRGDLVVIEHGSSKRGVIALIVQVTGGMTSARRWLPSEKLFAPPQDVPLWRVKGKPDRTDERAKEARGALKDMNERGEDLGGWEKEA